MKCLRLFVIILIIPLVTGPTLSHGAVSPYEKGALVSDQACAYLFFLRGVDDEYRQQFTQALQAYEKALICDPKALYIEKKLPILHFRLGENEQAAKLLKEGIKKDPEDTSQYLLLAHIAIQQNNRDIAIEVYRRALQYDPNDENVRLRLAILLVQKDRLDEGEKIFRDLIEKNKDLYLAQIYLARLLQMKGDNDEAARIYEEALDRNWSQDLVFEMIDFYTMMERYTDVFRLYDAILANDPTNEHAIAGKIQTLLAIGKDKEALKELKALRATNDNTDSLDLIIAKTLLRLNRIAEAKTVLDKLQQGPVENEANYLLGLIAFQAKQTEKALQYFQLVAADSPEYADAVYLQVRLLRDFSRYDRAYSLLEKVCAEPKGRDPLFFALLASLYQEKDRLDEAMTVLTKGTDIFPQSEQLHFERALLLERTGQRQQALATMQKVLAINPENPEALNYIGYTWADLGLNLDQAKQYILQAVDLKPDNGFIRDSLGWVEYRLGNYETARAELLQALDLEPDDPSIHEHLGDVYLALKKLAEARKAYQKSRELFSSTEDKDRLKRKIDELSATTQ
ncbi:MAG: tetratricopeptide repeat protein [Desulfopila sp.]